MGVRPDAVVTVIAAGVVPKVTCVLAVPSFNVIARLGFNVAEPDVTLKSITTPGSPAPVRSVTLITIRISELTLSQRLVGVLLGHNQKPVPMAVPARCNHASMGFLEGTLATRSASLRSFRRSALLPTRPA